MNARLRVKQLKDPCATYESARFFKNENRYISRSSGSSKQSGSRADFTPSSRVIGQVVTSEDWVVSQAGNHGLIEIGDIAIVRRSDGSWTYACLQARLSMPMEHLRFVVTKRPAASKVIPLALCKRYVKRLPNQTELQRPSYNAGKGQTGARKSCSLRRELRVLATGNLTTRAAKFNQLRTAPFGDSSDIIAMGSMSMGQPRTSGRKSHASGRKSHATYLDLSQTENGMQKQLCNQEKNTEQHLSLMSTRRPGNARQVGASGWCGGYKLLGAGEDARGARPWSPSLEGRRPIPRAAW
jgi:hypothetical protein